MEIERNLAAPPFVHCCCRALLLVLLTLVACGTFYEPSHHPTSISCGYSGTSDQAILAAAQTQEQNNAEYQAVATAEMVRANAQATLNSANATLRAAQTQEQNNANVIAAQVAATAEFNRANAQATLVAAGATQSAALTQDALRQTQHTTICKVHRQPDTGCASHADPAK